MSFFWNEKNNKLLKEKRGISFEQVVVAIEEGHPIDVLEHSNRAKYGTQLILIVEIDGYALCVPCVAEKDGDFFMKTLYRSRKYTKYYMVGGLL